VHGAAAKGAPDTFAGFASCQLCHGQDFAGGVVLAACSACHGIPAPHPEPWKWGTRTHANTDPANVPVCALCHDRDPSFNSSPAPPGVAFGCFNSTLCHGSVSPHPEGWANRYVHGYGAAMNDPDTTTGTGFASCQPCHGSDYSGFKALSCYREGCHSIPAPHPDNWRARSETDPIDHRYTDQANATVCGQCHGQPDATYFSCFGSTVTLCHSSY
jgi:hypothetical protein